MNNKEKFELVVNAGLQAIHYVGGPLATLYFGYKQEQRFQRIEQTLKEVAAELEGVTLPSLEAHSKDELTDKTKNEAFVAGQKAYDKFINGESITECNMLYSYQ